MKINLEITEEEFFTMLSAIEELQETMEKFLEDSENNEEVSENERNMYTHTAEVLNSVKSKIKKAEKTKDEKEN